jgi:hypothetical protein
MCTSGAPRYRGRAAALMLGAERVVGRVVFFFGFLRHLTRRVGAVAGGVRARHTAQHAASTDPPTPNPTAGLFAAPRSPRWRLGRGNRRAGWPPANPTCAAAPAPGAMTLSAESAVEAAAIGIPQYPPHRRRRRRRAADSANPTAVSRHRPIPPICRPSGQSIVGGPAERGRVRCYRCAHTERADRTG